MKTRVTITLDPEVHARAKAVARARCTTVSGLIEAFLRSPDAAGSGGSLVDEMLGCAELRSVADAFERAQERYGHEMLGCAELRNVEPGHDPLYDALHARHIARRP